MHNAHGGMPRDDVRTSEAATYLAVTQVFVVYVGCVLSFVCIGWCLLLLVGPEGMDMRRTANDSMPMSTPTRPSSPCRETQYVLMGTVIGTGALSSVLAIVWCLRRLCRWAQLRNLTVPTALPPVGTPLPGSQHGAQVPP